MGLSHTRALPPTPPIVACEHAHGAGVARVRGSELGALAHDPTYEPPDGHAAPFVGHPLRPVGPRGVRCPDLAKDPLPPVGRPERDGRRLGAGIGEQNSTRCNWRLAVPPGAVTESVE